MRQYIRRVDASIGEKHIFNHMKQRCFWWKTMIIRRITLGKFFVRRLELNLSKFYCIELFVVYHTSAEAFNCFTN